MGNIINTITRKKYHLIAEENSVTSIIKILDKYNDLVANVTTGNYGAPETPKWFIHFTTSKDVWKLIRDELKIVRAFDYSDIPDNLAGMVYSVD